MTGIRFKTLFRSTSNFASKLPGSDILVDEDGKTKCRTFRFKIRLVLFQTRLYSKTDIRGQQHGATSKARMLSLLSLN